MTRQRHIAWTVLAAALLFSVEFGATAPAVAASISILVNDEPITSYDIKQRTQMLKVFTHGKAGEKQAIDQLIDETLMMQEATRRHLAASDAEVEQEVSARARNGKLTAAQFDQALRQAGIDPKAFREYLRANMSWSQIVRARFRATVDITNQDVVAALGKKSEPGATEAATEYILQPILFLIPKGASKGAENARLQEAEAFRKAYQGCDNAVAQAGGTPGIVIKPHIRRPEDGLPPQFRDLIAVTEIGSATKPERVPEGYQIVAVCSKNTIAGETEATVKAREELSDERGQLLARRYLRDLRSDAVIEYR